MEDERSARASALADLITAAILIGVGLFVFIEAFNMPRLEQRRIHPLTIPGLVPMALGVALMGLAALLGHRALKHTNRDSLPAFLGLFRTQAAARAAVAAGLVLVFVLVLIGRMPFWAASMIFMFGFILVLEVVLTDEPSSLLRSALWGGATAILAGAAIHLLFAQIFLVRLP